MSGETKTLSYFGAMSGCFRGTTVFSTLIGHSMLRAVWHTVLTVILLGILTAGMQVMQLEDSFRTAADYFEAEFGGISLLEKQGVVPANKPGESHYLLLNRGGLLVYVPAGKSPVLPEKSSFKDYRYTLVWYPSNIVFIMPVEKQDKYAVNTMKFGETMGNRNVCDAAGLQRILQNAGKVEWVAPDGLEADYKLPADEVLLAVKMVAWIGYFGIFFFEAFSQVLMCLLIFGLFYAYFRKKQNVEVGGTGPHCVVRRMSGSGGCGVFCGIGSDGNFEFRYRVCDWYHWIFSGDCQ